MVAFAVLESEMEWRIRSLIYVMKNTFVALGNYLVSENRC